VMAILAVSRDLHDLRQRLGAITVAHSYDGGKPVTADSTRMEVTQGPDGRLKVNHHPKKGDEPKPATPTLEKPENAAKDGITANSADDSLTGAAAKPAAPAKPASPYAHISPPIGIYVPGTFSLRDTDGKPVTETSFPDKYLLIFFGYTHCPDICPVTMEKMTAALNQLGPLARSVQPLFVTIDPERDSEDVIKAYLAHYHNKFIGLTGSADQIKKAEESYKVYAAQIPGASPAEYIFDHSAYIYFMSPRNVMEQAFRIEQPTTAVVEKMRGYLDGSLKAKALAP